MRVACFTRSATVLALVAIGCSSSSEATGPSPKDSGGTQVDGAPDGSLDGADAVADGTDAFADGADAVADDADGATDAPIDAAGVICGASTCPVGQVCCVNPTDAGFSFTCATSCDAGATLSCDGPEDCPSAAPFCCANVDVVGTPPSCTLTSGNAACAETCATSFVLNCPSKATVRACKKAADCTEPAFSNCCTFSDGAGTTATFCAPNYMLSLAEKCF
jgi:hypothetical protein